MLAQLELKPGIAAALATPNTVHSAPAASRQPVAARQPAALLYAPVPDWADVVETRRYPKLGIAVALGSSLGLWAIIGAAILG